jgi:hypothetical protein
MSDAQVAPVLEYTDRPPDSRLIVRRDADGNLVITDPATGVWEQMRGFGLWVGLQIALWPFFVALVAWWFGMSAALIRRLLPIMYGWFTDWRFLLQVLVAMLVILTVCIVAGTWSRTYRVHGGSLQVETTHTWPLRRTTRRTFERGEVAAIRAARFRGQITLISPQQKRLTDLMVMRRADAKWLARVLVHELGLET